jgi:hypothetical protein
VTEGEFLSRLARHACVSGRCFARASICPAAPLDLAMDARQASFVNRRPSDWRITDCLLVQSGAARMSLARSRRRLHGGQSCFHSCERCIDAVEEQPAAGPMMKLPQTRRLGRTGTAAHNLENSCPLVTSPSSSFSSALLSADAAARKASKVAESSNLSVRLPGYPRCFSRRQIETSDVDISWQRQRR